MLNIDEIKDKRIAVLLSGGVDSSVVVGSLPSWACILIASTSRLVLRRKRSGTALRRRTWRWLRLWLESMGASCKWLTVIMNIGTR